MEDGLVFLVLAGLAEILHCPRGASKPLFMLIRARRGSQNQLQGQSKKMISPIDEKMTA
jgi:hypothetical protein